MVEWITGIIAFLAAWALVPFLRKMAFKYQFVDRPNHRKIHKDPLPLLGGAAIFVGFLVATLCVQSWWSDQSDTYIGLVLGSVLLFAIGLVDDYYKTRGKDFPAAPRFLCHIAAGYLLVAFGGTVNGFTMPFPDPHYIEFSPLVSTVVTIIWVALVINVFNFLDGMDGLAGGISAISAMTLGFVALMKGETSSALWAIALAGSSLGFLKHNFFPARIIMGDAGSTLIGYLLAAISVIGAFKSVTVISIFVPVLALGVPIFDAMLVITRRILKGNPPHKPDRTHGHHRLLDAGFTQVQAVAILYMVSVCFSLTSLIVLLVNR